jgi:hypothetical protein
VQGRPHLDGGQPGSTRAAAGLARGRVRWSLPLGFKRSEATSKVLLKRVLGRYVPQSMVHRPSAVSVRRSATG